MEKYHKFLESFGRFEKILPIAQEASSRIYYRIYYESGTKVLCVDDNFQNLPYAFLQVNEFLLQNDFSIPKILGYDLGLRVILQEDAGEKDLTSIDPEENYVSTLKIEILKLLKLQELKPIPIIQSREFHYEKLNFELNFTYTHYETFRKSNNLDIDFSPPQKEFLDQAIIFLSKYETKVICHRDFHARNIMMKDSTNYWIDYQDMMMGTPHYDVSSLLYDAYKPLSLTNREMLYQFFKDNSSHKKNRFREYYLTQCLQRSFKALGSYLYLLQEKKMLKYKPSIKYCLLNLMEISQLGLFPDSMYLFVSLLLKRLEEDGFFE
ncbi:MAG: phosphotransferase [Leptospiraceae bacterium]|nr:phosphotransferase [Leptospiraceae bacterium]